MEVDEAGPKLTFVRYTSIDNHSTRDVVDLFKIEGHTQKEWVGTEKGSLTLRRFSFFLCCGMT